MIKLVFIAVLFLIILIAVFLYVIMPGENRDYSRFAGLMYAHRGLHEPAREDNNMHCVPENSLEAFKRAREAGYGVELDVQYTKDKKLVVFHDANLKRMCGVDAKVADYDYEELSKFRLKDTDQKIPLFEEVLKTLEDVPLVCEIKTHNGNFNDRLCEDTYNLLKDYKGDYCIESFSPYLVRWFRDNHPEIIRGQLSCGMKNEMSLLLPVRIAMTHLLINFVGRPDFIAYRHSDMRKLGFVLCKKIYHPLIVAWTARGEKEQMQAWKKADAVIFEKYEDDSPVE